MGNWSFFYRSIAFIGISLLCTLSLPSIAKTVNQKVIVKENENIEIAAKQGIFSVYGWDESTLELSGEVSAGIQVDHHDSALVLTFASQDLSLIHI